MLLLDVIGLHLDDEDDADDICMMDVIGLNHDDEDDGDDDNADKS